jgi:transcriptional regulator with XRE-family HTH domain
MEKFERIKVYRDTIKLSQKAFFDRYGVSQSNASKYENGTVALPDELEAALAADGLNLDWLATGRGEMLIGAVSQQRTYEIPLLTREQALRFDPAQEIPEPKANSGDYPDIAYIPVPRRVLEYGTDLRAIEVFGSRMFPVLKSGDIAIFEATGMGGNGIYLYRMGGKLHITYAGLEDNHFRLFSEIEDEIALDPKTYFPIGRVRAVVSDLFGYDWRKTAQQNIEQVVSELRTGKADWKKYFAESGEKGE